MQKNMALLFSIVCSPLPLEIEFVSRYVLISSGLKATYEIYPKAQVRHVREGEALAFKINRGS